MYILMTIVASLSNLDVIFLCNLPLEHAKLYAQFLKCKQLNFSCLS